MNKNIWFILSFVVLTPRDMFYSSNYANCSNTVLFDYDECPLYNSYTLLELHFHKLNNKTIVSVKNIGGQMPHAVTFVMILFYTFVNRFTMI